MRRTRMADTMALYLIGDVQGCDAPWARLLDEDRLLAQPRHAVPAGRPGQPRPGFGRGAAPRSWATATRRACLLGNHDLSLLAVAHGARARRTATTPWTTCWRRPTATRCSTGCATSAWRCTTHGDLLMVHGGRAAAMGRGADAGAGGRSGGGAARPGTGGLPARRCTATSRRSGTMR